MMKWLYQIPKNKTQLAELLNELKSYQLLNEHWMPSDKPNCVRVMWTGNFEKFTKPKSERVVE